MPHYKVLVIDYEPRGVSQLRDPLHAAGYLVSVAHDGVSGMQLFEEIQPDLTLVEAMLPKKHGFEVCRDLKKTPHGARSPVVIVTSVYRGRKYRTQAFHNYNCDEFLEKPISSATLLSTVERLLQDRVSAPSQPEAAPAPPPQPEPEAVQAQPLVDEAESEISERLDELLGGGPDSGPKAQTTSVPGGDKVLSFDPARGRKATTFGDATAGPGGRPTTPAGRGPAAAEAIPAQRAYPAVGDQLPQVSVGPRPEVRRPTVRTEPAPRRTRGKRGRLLLLLTILVVAAASSAVFLLLNWPF